MPPPARPVQLHELPNDLLPQILAKLPYLDAVRARKVNKAFNDAGLYEEPHRRSRKLLENWPDPTPLKPPFMTAKGAERWAANSLLSSQFPWHQLIESVSPKSMHELATLAAEVGKHPSQTIRRSGLVFHSFPPQSQTKTVQGVEQSSTNNTLSLPSVTTAPRNNRLCCSRKWIPGGGLAIPSLDRCIHGQLQVQHYQPTRLAVAASCRSVDQASRAQYHATMAAEHNGTGSARNGNCACHILRWTTHRMGHRGDRAPAPAGDPQDRAGTFEQREAIVLRALDETPRTNAPHDNEHYQQYWPLWPQWPINAPVPGEPAAAGNMAKAMSTGGRRCCA